MARLLESLPSAHLDGLLVTSLPNIRWLTGFSGSNALLLVTARERLLLTDFRYEAQAKEEVGGLVRVVIESNSLWTGLWQHTATLSSVETVGFESSHIMHRDFQRLLETNGGARWQWRPTTELVEVHRQVKDAEEVRKISVAVEMAEAALARTVEQVRVGMTEQTICGILEKELRISGSETAPFEPIIASGPRAALPHARASSRALGADEWLLIDFGARYEGYVSDITRTFVAGTPDDRQREVYEIVRTANELATAQVRAGMTGRDADAVARRYIADQGEGSAFGHSLGHGIGLEVHESPRLARTAEAVLPSGAVVTIEPGIYHAEWGGVRVEDNVVLSADGARVLTRFSRDLCSIG